MSNTPVLVRGYTYIGTTAPTGILAESETWWDSTNKKGKIYTSDWKGNKIWAELNVGGGVTNPGGPGSNYGYCMGGFNGTVTSIIDRITFPFDSGTASAVGNLSGTRYYSAGCDGTDFVTLFI